MTANGLIWWSTPRATVGLVVAGGRVVECPPYARRWAMGRDARQVWREQYRAGADLVWVGQADHPPRPGDPAGGRPGGVGTAPGDRAVVRRAR